MNHSRTSIKDKEILTFTYRRHLQHHPPSPSIETPIPVNDEIHNPPPYPPHPLNHTPRCKPTPPPILASPSPLLKFILTSMTSAT